VLFDFQKQHAIQAIYEPAAIAAAKHKAGRIAARLCLTLHCVRAIEETGHLWGVAVVSKETAENAVALASWFLNESERVYAMLAGETVGGTLTPDQKCVMKVLHSGKTLTVCGMKKNSRVLRTLENERIEKILTELLKLDLVEREFDISIGNHGAVWYQIKKHDVDAVGVGTRRVFPENCDSNADATTAPNNVLPETDVVEGGAECSTVAGSENSPASTVPVGVRPLFPEIYAPNADTDTTEVLKNEFSDTDVVEGVAECWSSESVAAPTENTSESTAAVEEEISPESGKGADPDEVDLSFFAGLAVRYQDDEDEVANVVDDDEDF